MDVQQDGLEQPIVQEEAPIITVDRISGEPEAIPDKFRGKSIDDVMKSYTSIESEWSKTKNKVVELEAQVQEANKLKAELDLARQQQALLQQQNQYFMQQTSQPERVQQRDNFSELWEHDPANAVKKAISDVQASLELKLNARETISHYDHLKKTRPDFAELEPVMEQVSQILAPSIDPSFRATPAAVDAMYFLAKGIKADEMAKKAATKGMEEARNLQNEKNSAMSEGSSSPAPAKDFSSMSTTELREYLLDHKIAQSGF